MKWLLVLIGCLAYREVYGVSQRKIYTFFTEQKSWNDAHDICESQFGQLMKLEDYGHIEEVQFLDETQWDDRTTVSGAFTWTGLHSNTSTWTYQDCEGISTDIMINDSNPGNCSALDANHLIVSRNCSLKAYFICERYEGDCWYKPHVSQMLEPAFPNQRYNKTIQNTDANLCAMDCRNSTESGAECWGFRYFQNQSSCELYYYDGINASLVYPKTSPVAIINDTDTVFYVRKCFEGSFDDREYKPYDDASENPLLVSDCDTTVYPGDPALMTICYCSTEDQPPIPEPITAEEKAAKLAEELSMDASNTSAATRKLSSAEDNRPSAVGVGIVGIGLLSAVFGGLFLMDLNLLITGIKDLLCSTSEATAANHPDQDF